MTEHSDRSQAPKFFYGWIMVGMLLLLLSVGWGTTVYMYSVVAGAVGAEFQASRFVLMMGSTGMLLMVAMSSPFLGTLLDRYPNKWVLAAGTLLMGVGFIVVSLSPTVWTVVASYVLLVGLGTATLSILTVSTLLTRWFVRHRGLAVGIAALGTQLGGFIYPPIYAAVMEAFNWRIAIGGMGVLIIAIVPLLIWLLVVDRPEDKNLLPDGDTVRDPAATADRHSAAPAGARLSFPELFAQRNFLLAVLVLGAAVAANTVLLANLSLFATDLGEPPVRGAFLVSLIALTGVICSPLVGWMCDAINIKVVAAIVTLSMVVANLIFSVANTYPLLVVATVIQGIGGGGAFPLWASMIARLYHTRVYGQVMGSATMVISGLTALAPLFAGWIHDTTSSYRVVFLTILVVLSVVTLLLPFIRVPRTPEERFGASPSDTVVAGAGPSA